MQTQLQPEWLNTPDGQTADTILRNCVHCGFCLSACPTYGLLGDELDSPRGRIYLIKSLLEGNDVSRESLSHLDSCLTCLSCETTCPSGVEYGHLLDIGRHAMEQQVTRPLWQRLMRWGVRKSLTTPWLFNLVVRVMPFLRHSSAIAFSVQELALQQQLADRADVLASSVLLLKGCVQPALAPNINQASIKVLNKLGWNVIETTQSQCCGALNQHLSAHDDALAQVKANIDAWYPYLQQGVKAIISTASGCGVMLKDYGHLLRADPIYAEKAQAIAQASKDISEFLLTQDLSKFTHFDNQTITFHSPCTLQHGQQLQGVVEQALRKLGYRVNPVKDAHLCCGSAGTYSLFNPTMAKQLRDNKLENLLAHKTDVIVTANIGCLMHLQKGTEVQVKHWIEIL
ncbi:MAG TPA: glycolate oxidase subunit GlcF [Thiotrichales bacterium]|nr:MAG: glycolate oxidase iron-sulfur subunit [Thiotrichales bacterium 35-46-9]OYZ42042.1 MAG: glycolate oxidase iron-sulfur subunit [Thiotrichales bacterium 24-47-4]OZA74589.1 MAG: glycolate oxidase iron-sulfur subunit [Thiotrichales bacterium 39-47-5]HQR81928.1 glycolate oxidase subunit GlcF [Thiotrichales bacterium]